MSFSIELQLNVPFYDLDPMMIVWHGNYMKYFDKARFALFDAAGIDLYHYMIDKNYAFLITRTSTKHIFPLKPRDEFKCIATVTEARNKIVIEFEIRKLDGVLCTRGQSEQLAVRLPNMELEFEIPLDIRKAFGF